ncbi:SusD/RagB family nutrient-binding outer membrane lipoprotein [Sediminibacterium soli]|uniref:SusD/RagB family nutrient-binding outer membrane lipoprotein n=1 Tax=Sediminibacterium soli TaxID=2698829 RepID=UPI001379D4C4|nr:SusD/RagB family nutrient-binding outer membrane lipoprotein [Sediminibacterium soli]NCI46074.1 SusD/RagB family nutrient-binding outer membrane lipoprotein [Sediminibacterium soli]
MKHTFFKSVLALAAICSIAMVSCKKKLDEAYPNPNASTKVPVETLLPSLIGNFLGSSSAAGSSYGLGGDGLLVSRYIQYYATSSTLNAFDQMSGATGASDNMGSIWAMHYYGQGQNLNRMVEWAADDKKWDYVGVGYAIRAWSWFMLTNEYGDVILKNAFNTSLQSFPYDTQQDVYDTVRATCFKALDYLNRTGDGVNQANLAIGDAYFYKGDVTKWKKFVYGVLARSYAYLHNKTSYSADSVIKYTNLAMTSNDDNATCKFANTGISGTSSYLGILRSNMGALRQTEYIVNLMTGKNSVAFTGVEDPRAWYLLRENPNGTLKGIKPNKGASGLSTADQPNNFWGGSFATTATPANENNCRYLFLNDAEFPIMTAAEMQFLKAEALLRKNDRAGALAAYSNAISLNFDMLTTKYARNIPPGKEITPSVKAAYLAQAAIVPAAANLTYTHIMLQKYIALHGYGFHETWTDIRRYHYDKDLDPVTGKPVYADFVVPFGSDLYIDNGGKPVYRARPRYNSEYLYNIPELTRIGAYPGADYHTKECWFSQK